MERKRDTIQTSQDTTSNQQERLLLLWESSKGAQSAITITFYRVQTCSIRLNKWPINPPACRMMAEVQTGIGLISNKYFSNS